MAVRRFLFLLVLLMAAVGVLCATSLTFFVQSAVVVSFWPANALALAFLLRGFKGSRQRSVALLGVLAVMGGVNLAFGGEPAIALGFAFANVLEIAVAAWVMRGAPMPLADARTLLRLVLGGVLLGPMASSLVAALAIGLVRGADGAFAAGRQWLVCDMLGMAVFAPAFLAAHWKALPDQIATRAILRLAGGLTLVAAVTFIAFEQSSFPFLFAITPSVILAVWLSRATGGAAAVAVVAAIGALMTAAGYGPIFATETSIEAVVLVLQAFVAAQILTVHPLSLALARLDRYAAAAHARGDKAQRESAARAKLLAHVSHEIRSPLSGVLGLAELMRNGALGELSPAQMEGVSRIADCAAEMQDLAADLLDTAAVQSGRVSVSLGPTDLSEALHHAIAASRFRTREYEPQVVLSGAPAGGLQVMADPARLKQILINLLVNAAKYGGRPPQVEIAVREAGGRVRIEISDNGKGVPAHLRERLFTPFDRMGAETSGLEGTGLGLAVARELAELQGGALGVEDGPLGGARFWIELDRAAAAVAA